LGVGRGSEFSGATAKHLGLGQQLSVHFQPDDGFEFWGHKGTPWPKLVAEETASILPQ
jgi:hypothetical protein